MCDQWPCPECQFSKASFGYMGGLVAAKLNLELV
jgi:hypothetical protein